MKWILLLIASAAVVPLAGWLRQNPRQAPKLWILVGFLAVEQGPLHTYMALDSWAGQWPGYTFGAEISLLDLICIAIYLTLPRSRHSLPFLFSIGLYFFAASLSVFQASVQTPSVFYVWQLARVFFFYTVVTKACAADERVVPALLKGIAFGMFLAAGQAIWERFGAGVLQTAGGFPHRNFLGMVSHFIVYPFFALLLAGERGWLPLDDVARRRDCRDTNDVASNGRARWPGLLCSISSFGVAWMDPSQIHGCWCDVSRRHGALAVVLFVIRATVWCNS